MEKHLQIISRADAKRLGMKHYFTGKPCRNKHVSERRVYNGKCTSCLKNMKARREKEIKARDKKYYEGKKSYIRAKQKEYYILNKSRILKKNKQWIDKNKNANKEYKAAWAVKDRKENPHKHRLANSRRRCLEMAAQGHHTADDIKRLLTEQRNRCAACNADLNKTGHHIDHVQPLARGGTNWPDNLQILCPHCNLSKGAKDPVEWAQSRGKLL